MMAHVELTNVVIGIDVIVAESGKLYRLWCQPTVNGKKYHGYDIGFREIEQIHGMLSGVIGGSKHNSKGKGRGPRGKYKKRLNGETN